MEKIVKTFTRDLSLLISEWWYDAQRKRFAAELGRGYNDSIAVNAGLSTSYFFLESDLAAVKDAVLDKFRENHGYYFEERGKFLEIIKRAKALVADLYVSGSLTLGVLSELKSLFFAAYPVYRYTLNVPGVWAEDVKKVLGSNAGATLSIAFKDREFAEGTFEALDGVLLKLIRAKLRKLKKPEKFAKYLTAMEVEALAVGEEVNWGGVAERTAGYVYCKGTVHVRRDYLNVFRENGYSYEEEKVTGNSLTGNVTFKGGVIKGKVQLLFTVEQAPEFKEGRILVTPMTVPDFVPAMKKAAAIITDEGGITCHAAIVSRELKIPCVIATKVATKLLKDGDEIELDTERGIVRKLNQAK